MALSALMLSAPLLAVVSTDNALLYQRQAANLINSSLENAVELGTVTSDQTQVNVGSKLVSQNTTNYYKFTLDGSNVKMDFSNVTNSSTITAQLIDSEGTVIADSAGTQEQQDAYALLTSWDGLNTEAGDYYVKVSFGATASKADAQTYSLSLYSGNQFNKSFQTTAVPQTSLSQKVVVDNTLTFMSSDAKYFTKQQYHRVNETVESAVNLGWLYENKGALSTSSKITDTNFQHYYTFALQKGNALKMAFNNTTDTTGLRFQVTDSTGYSVFADNYGTDAQKAAYEKLTSPEGLAARPGQYAVKVSFAPSADRTKEQYYNFNVYSGDVYTSLYKTTASAETYDTAKVNGTLLTGNYNAATASASYLYGLAQGDEVDIFSVLSGLSV